MNILGIAFAAHNSSVALLQNGKLKFFIEEERLNRIKDSGGFPILGIKKCLNECGLKWDDIHAISYFRNPLLEATGNFSHFIKYFPQTLKLLSYSPDKKEASFLKRLFTGDGIKSELKKEFGKLPKFYFIEHHMAHAASAYYGSGFEKAAVVTIDGRGESITTLICCGEGEKLRKLQEVKVPHSLGHLYAAITNYLGFSAFHDEWKVMGMAAYGDSSLDREFEQLVHLSQEKIFELDLSYFSFHTEGQNKWLSPKFYEKFGPAREKNAPLEKKHFNMAHALQKTIEKSGIHLAKLAYELTGSENICLAGGVALNCLMNSAIVENTAFKKIFVQPMPHDAGTSYGSALYLHHAILGNVEREKFKTTYLGPSFSEDQIEAALKKRNISYEKSASPAKIISKALEQNQIVGLFQGAMEAGPRALGNRSILANPTNADAREILNSKIKRRESFRPLAPAVLEEFADDYFDLPKKNHSPYMILTAPVKQEMKEKIPAVVHEDGSARVQTVNKETNPLFWQILHEFYQNTGTPVLLNTSFNENEPIVCTPDEAIDCFQRTQMDLLCLENFIVKR